MIWVEKKMIKREYFPSGELILKKEDFSDLTSPATILMKWTDDKDLFHLWLVKKELDKRKINAILEIAYMPYARMDRENDFYSETLSYTCDFINSLKFEMVYINDPHSEVTLEKCERAEDVYYTDYLVNSAKKFLNWDYSKDFICFPDGGAFSKYTKLTTFKKILSLSGDFCFDFIKERDFKTGKIIGHKPSFGWQKPTEKSKILIIDDVCSRGGTYVSIADSLNGMGIFDIHLVVSHLEYNVLNGEIIYGDKIKSVWTTNSLFEKFGWETKDKLHIVDVYPNNDEGVAKKEEL